MTKRFASQVFSNATFNGPGAAGLQRDLLANAGVMQLQAQRRAGRAYAGPVSNSNFEGNDGDHIVENTIIGSPLYAAGLDRGDTDYRNRSPEDSQIRHDGT